MNKSKILKNTLACLIPLAFSANVAIADSYAPAKAFIPNPEYTPDLTRGADNFYKSDKLEAKKVTFNTMYGLKVTGNMFTPKNAKKDVKLPAIIVGHPMGATKEQSAQLYAQKLAEQGFVTIAIDLSYWGESEGEPRNTVAPELYAEDFIAAVDFLGMQANVDRNNIGVLGICGSGSFAISAAKIDPRIKAIGTVSMYDMGEAVRTGLNKSGTLEQRKALIKAAADERWAILDGKAPQYTSGTVDSQAEATNDIAKEFFDFYRTKRGAYGESKTTTHPTLVSFSKFANFYPFEDIDTISPRPVLFVAGENAHSRAFSEDAYKLSKEPKELVIVKDAGHVDLYDRTEVIPFDKLTSFYKENLK